MMNFTKLCISSFMQLFWEQQKKAAQSNGSMKYQPMVLRFCLSLVAKSSSAFDELRSLNVLMLPSRSFSFISI